MAKTIKKSADVSSPALSGRARRQASVRLRAAAVDSYREDCLDDAIKGYGQALAADPANWDVYNSLGVALLAQRKSAAAISCFKRALTLNPKSARAYSGMGNALRIMNNFEESLAAKA